MRTLLNIIWVVFGGFWLFLGYLIFGLIVDEAALLEALNGGKVRAAGLDVWLSEKDPNWTLAQHPSVSCTPHVGAGTVEAQKRIGAELVDIVEESFS